MALKCQYLATKQHGGTSQQTNINFMSVDRCKFCCKMLAFVNVCVQNVVGIGRERCAIGREGCAIGSEGGAIEREKGKLEGRCNWEGERCNWEGERCIWEGGERCNSQKNVKSSYTKNDNWLLLSIQEAYNVCHLPLICRENMQKRDFPLQKALVIHCR
jgi:hypothetical protein